MDLGRTAIYQDRADAGKKLAQKLLKYRSTDALVLALPRGGVVLGHEIAKILHLPLDVFIVRKLGSPYNPELGIGAITELGTAYFNWQLVTELGVKADELQAIVSREMLEIKRRLQVYRQGRNLPRLRQRKIILVDDGVATGVSAIAAIMAIGQQKPERLVFAVPVCARDQAVKIKHLVNVFISLHNTMDLGAIGSYYQDFTQVTDDEVLRMLRHIV